MVAVDDQTGRTATEALETRRRDRVDWPRLAPYLLAIAFAVVYATVSLARLHRQATMSWDVAIFEQAISGYAHLAAPIADIKGPGYNVLGLHFSPALAVFAPFYRLFPEPTTLLVGQALLVALSVAVIARAAIRHLGAAAGLAIGLAYGLSWGIQSGIDFDFHEVCLAMPLLALAGAAYLARDWPMVAVWSLPLLLVKEDFGLTIAALGGCLLLCGARRWGTALVLSGAIGFVVTVFVLIPMANPAGSSEFWAGYGSDGGVGSVLEQVLSSPEQLVTPGVKIETLLLLLAITGGLALRSPFALVAVPTVAWRFLSDNPAYWGTDWHYSMVLMPILFIALIDGIMRARQDDWAWLRSYASHAPAVVVAVALILCFQFPFRSLVHAETYEAAPRAAVAEHVLDLIPDGASVESDLGLLTQLAGEHTVYWLGTNNSAVAPDYVLIDAWSGWEPPAPDAAEHAMSLHPGTTYRVIFHRDGYELAQRVD